MDVAYRSRQCATCGTDHDYNKFSSAVGAVSYSALKQDRFASTRHAPFHEERSCGAFVVATDTLFGTTKPACSTNKCM